MSYRCIVCVCGNVRLPAAQLLLCAILSQYNTISLRQQLSATAGGCSWLWAKLLNKSDWLSPFPGYLVSAMNVWRNILSVRHDWKAVRLCLKSFSHLQLRLLWTSLIGQFWWDDQRDIIDLLLISFISPDWNGTIWSVMNSLSFESHTYRIIKPCVWSALLSHITNKPTITCVVQQLPPGLTNQHVVFLIFGWIGPLRTCSFRCLMLFFPSLLCSSHWKREMFTGVTTNKQTLRSRSVFLF